MPSIDKRPNGTWRARWREYAGGPQRTRTFDRKVDAEQFLDAIRGDLARGAYIDPDAARQSFASFADEWAAHRRRLFEHLGPVPLGSIDLVRLQDTQQALGERYARSTVTTTMSYVGTIMRAAHASGRVGRDPTKGLRAPKLRAGEPDGKVGPDHVPTRAEAAAILTGAPAPYRAAIALGIAGLRVGEVIGMTADRIDLGRREVTVDRQLQRIGNELVLTTPKAERVRTIVGPGSRRQRATPAPQRPRSGGAAVPRSSGASDPAGPALCVGVEAGPPGGGARRSVHLPRAAALLRLHAARRRRSAVGRRRPSGRHRGDGEPHLRALAPRRSRRPCGRPGTRLGSGC